MEKIFQNPNLTIAVDDIEHITNDTCEALESGDIVRKVKNDFEFETYSVSYKTSDEMSLTYNGLDKTKVIKYKKVANAWVYDKTEASTIEIGTGKNAVQQKTEHKTVNFAGRNPNAQALDPSISATINTGASGNQSSSFGKDTMALSTASFSNGNKALAKGEESHAEGYQSVTLGDGSHAEGEQTTTAGSVSHSEGSNTVAGGYASHSEGVRSKTTAYSNIENSGIGSHAEGESSNASGYCSHTEGFGAYTGKIDNAPEYPITPEPEPSPSPTPTPPTEQVGNLAHAEGNYCFAIGTGSHAEGYHTKALHEASHAEGVCTKTSNAGQSVCGYYNDDDSRALFIVGNGTAEDARSNAFMIFPDGTLGLPNYDGNGNILGYKRIKCVNGALTIID